MRKFRKLANTMAWMCGVLAFTALPSVTSAAVQFSYAASVKDVTLMAGESTSVTVYLVETVTGTDASLLAAEKGLEFAEVRVTREQPGGASIGAFAPNPAFNDSPFVTTTPGSAPYSMVDVSQGVSISASSGVSGTAVNGVTSVPLLTLTIQAGATSGQTSFSLTDYPGATETITYANNIALDSQIASGLFTVTTTTMTPEPASLIVLLGGALAASRRVRRR